MFVSSIAPMKTKFFYLFLMFVVCGKSFSQSQVFDKPKLSAGTLQYLWLMEQGKANEKGVLENYVYQLSASNQLLVNTVVKVSASFNEKSILDLGAKVGTKAGNIWTVRVPVSRMKDFSKTIGILAIEMDQPMAPQLDSARRRTRVDSIHKGLGLPQAYSGENVVVGVIDAGFDYTHPTNYDTAYSRFRVKRVWEQKAVGTPPSAFGYGAEFADSASILTKTHDVSETTHGTHVAGIAGGSGFGGQGGNKTKYRGIAFGSDMVFTAIYPSVSYWLNTGMADMLDGINYTFQYGASVGKPAVANLSWGCPLGPRDGSSLFSQAVDNLVGPGKIFVLSGGNNGQNKIHLKKTFTPTDTVVNTFTTFSTSLSQKQNQIDVWGDSANSFCMQFSLYNGNTKITSSEFICLDGVTRLIKLKGSFDTCYFTVTGVISEFNQRPHMLIQILNKASDRLGLTLKATSGTVNMWQGIVVKTSGYYGAFTKYTYPWAVDGDALMTCGDLVSTRKAIAVAAYNSKVSFLNVSGQTQTYSGYQRGRIAAFSSVGPTTDGRIKPNIAGPGLALASAVSSYDSSYLVGGADYGSVVSKYVLPQNGKTYSFGMAGGTSMSSPAVSGIVAILLQANPLLSPSELMDIFTQTAIKDNFTGQIPPGGSNTWGFGKINAYGSLKKLLETTGINHIQSNERFLVYPNPNEGSFNLEYLGTGKENLEVKIFDQLGKEYEGFVWQVGEGSQIRKLNSEKFPPGVYHIRLKSNSETGTVRIIVR